MKAISVFTSQRGRGCSKGVDDACFFACYFLESIKRNRTENPPKNTKWKQSVPIICGYSLEMLPGAGLISRTPSASRFSSLELTRCDSEDTLG